MSTRRVALLLVAVVVLAACDGHEPDGAAPPTATPAPSAAPVPGGKLIVGVYGEPATFDPYSPLASDLTLALARPLYRSVFRFDEGGEPVPDLARRVRTSGDLATIVLKQATWSDGHPITARDVVGSLRRAALPGVEDVRRRGPRAVLVVGRVADWPRLLARGSYVLPADGRVAYSGPFALRSRVPGLQLVLHPNPTAEDPPFVDRLTVRFTEGIDMLVALLEEEEIDVAWLPSSVNLSARLDETELEHDAQLGWETVVMDLKDSDLSVAERRAVVHAVDRGRIAAAFIRDHGRIADTVVPDLSTEGASGPYERVFRGSSEVDDVPVRVAAPGGDELLELVQRLGQVMLTGAGFDVELINVDARRFYGAWAVEAPVDVALRRRAGILAPAASTPPRRSLRLLPLLQVDTVVAWISGVGGVSAAAGPEGPLANAHEWHVVPRSD